MDSGIENIFLFSVFLYGVYIVALIPHFYGFPTQNHMEQQKPY